MLILLMTNSDILQSVIISILCGFAVSLLFLFFVLHFLRPKFEISKFICVVDDAYGRTYRFKVVNKSNYHAFNTKFELFLMEPSLNTIAQINLKYKPLNINPDSLNHCPRNRKKQHKDDPSNLFATLIRTNDNIEKMLEAPNTYIELKITSWHGLTGLGGAFTQQFGGADSIKVDNKFESANKTNTIHINNLIGKS